MHDDELHTAFMNARSSERLQLLELLESKLDPADKTSRDQVFSALKDWINLRRPSANETKPETTQ
ncbi:hypothetical protein ACRS8K_07160 [Serratia marcescens]